MFGRISSLLIKSFFQGLVILGPIAITVYAVIAVFTTLDGVLPFANKLGPGIGFLIIVLVILLVGYFGTRFLVGRMLVKIFDFLLEKIPGIKFLYSAVKEIIESFVGDKKKFTHPVWVKVSEHPEIFRIGFLTQTVFDNAPQEEFVPVYLPHSYAISGWVIVVHTMNIKHIENMTAAEAMKFAVSGGITTQ